MLLRAGVVSLVLLVASRLLGLLRESAQAAAFGTSELADLAVLMLTLPDWLTSVAVSGALAYVLVPAWAGQLTAQVARGQRRVALRLLAGGVAVAMLLAGAHEVLRGVMAPGVPASGHAAQAVLWSAAALPLAVLASLWATRLQHERDFTGLYGANLVVNVVVIGAIAAAAPAGATSSTRIAWLGAGLVFAMAMRLAWQHVRLRRHTDASDRAYADADADAASPPLTPTASAASQTSPLSPARTLVDEPVPLPAWPVWLWAALAAGLPLALPVLARSIASTQGPGALATFSYAWKLVELPLVLAIQLVATLALPAVAAAVAGGLRDAPARRPIAAAFALAWSLACAAAAALIVGADAFAQLVFGWGRMPDAALREVAAWSRVAAWGLLPQALAAVALAVLAAQRRMRWAVGAQAVALAALGLAALFGLRSGEPLMWGVNVAFGWVALVVIAALGSEARAAVPWRAGVAPLAVVALAAALAPWASGLSLPWSLVAAALAGGAVLGAAWLGAGELRQTLRR